MPSTVVLIFCLSSAGAGVSSSDLDEFSQKVRANRVACGPTSVCYCLRRLGLDASLDDVMRRAKLAEDGMSAHDVIELCQSLGQHPRAIVGPVSALAELPVPSILVIDDRHCVVYDGMDGPTHARIFEPVTLRSGLESREWLSQHWTGEAIVFADVKPTHGRAMFQAVSAASLTLLVGWGIHRGFKGVVNMRLRRLAHD